MVRTLFFSLSLLFSLPIQGSPPDKSLQRTDLARGHLEQGVRFSIEISCKSPSKTVPLERSFEIRALKNRALALATSPSRYAGDRVVVNGWMVWEIRKDSDAPTPVPLVDRQTGLAAIGDLVAMTLHELYEARSPGEYVAIAAERVLYPTAQATFHARLGVVDRLNFRHANGAFAKTVAYEYTPKVRVGSYQGPFVTKALVRDHDGEECSIGYSSPTADSLKEDDLNIETYRKK